MSQNGLILIEREQSLQFLADRNMTLHQLEELVLSLSVSDCVDGPEPDRDPRYCENWTVAEFSPIHDGKKLYLKISIRVDAQRCKCLSVKLFKERV